MASNQLLISQYYESINSVTSKKTPYINAKNSLNNSVLPNLNSAKEEILNSKKEQITSFSIDGNAVCDKEFENAIDKIDTIINKINEKIIPGLDAKISEFNGLIDYYNELITIESRK